MQIRLFIFVNFCILCCYSEYHLLDDYIPDRFADMFTFYEDNDPVWGFVNYVGQKTALESGLFKVMDNNTIYIGVDATNKADVNGRKSIRLHSKRRYTHGLFILDLEHMPSNVCGTWVALWMLNWGQNYPDGGEIHAIDGVHTIDHNTNFLVSSNNCHISNSSSAFTGHLESSNCKFDAPQALQGCQIPTDQTNSYGDGFNRIGGGIIFATTFCGFKGNLYWDSMCGAKHGQSCKQFVQNNPDTFKESFWLIRSLRVYSDPTLKPLSTMPSNTFTTLNQTTKPLVLTTAKSTHKFSNPLFFGIFIPALVILSIICVVFFRHRYKEKRRKKAICALAMSGRNLFSGGLVSQISDDLLWEIPRENLVIQTKIGFGAFAEVYISKLIGDAAVKRVFKESPALSKFCDCDVAVKVLPPFASEAAKIDLQKEIEFMKSLKFHTNLVCLLGCVSGTISPMLVLEYCANSDLLQFLQKNKNNIIYVNGQENIRLKSLVLFSWQIANGLHYLTNLGLIHRDVAARNILVDKDYVCKIGDFGLCRLTNDEIYASRGGKLPIRWMSIESLKRSEFSMKTDVHSNILPFLESGRRLQRPMYATDETYNLMLNCWQLEPRDRPTFAQIVQFLTQPIENNNIEYNYIEAISLFRSMPSIPIVDSEYI